MSTYISVYCNNPSKDSKDGTLISENGSYSTPLSVTLNASEEESKVVKCAIRCKDGYATVGDTILKYEGNGSSDTSLWSFAADNDYTEETAKEAVFTDTLTISDEIDNHNKIFWVKAASRKTESPSNDTSISMVVTATIKAVD